MEKTDIARPGADRARKVGVDTLELTIEDFVPQVESIISVGEFYAKAAGGQIVFT